MAVKYDGKSPGKLWYFWQNTKALAQTPFQYATAADAKKAGKDIGMFAGIATGTSIVLSVPVIAALPVVPLLLSLAGFSWALHHGWQGFHKMRALKNSSFVYSYVRSKEDQWVERKAKGNIFKRTLKSVKDKVNTIKNAIPLPLVKAGKWLGFAAAGIGAVAGAAAGLSYAGLPAFSTGATATAILGGIAQAGAIVGLSAAAAVATVTGLALAAVPVGILAARWCSSTAHARDPNRPVFGKAKTPAGGQPIEQGEVFKPKSASFEFNGNSTTATPVNDDMSEARKKAAAQRAANRARGGRGNRFS